MRIKSTLITSLLSILTTQAQIYNTADSLALLAIDASCDQKNSLNWNTNSDPAKWRGVKWSSYTPKRVIALNIGGSYVHPKMPYITYSSFNLSGSLDISNLDSLVTIDCNYNSLTSVRAEGLEKLSYLRVDMNKVENLYLDSLPNITAIYCITNNLSHLEIADMPKLQSLNCSSNHLTNLKITNTPSLNGLYYSSNSLINLSLEGLKSLESIDCSFNNLMSLNVASLENLKALRCPNNKLTDIDITNNLKLESFICSNNLCSNLNLENQQNLRELYCDGNLLCNLDLSACVNLSYLKCSNNLLTNLSFVGLSNLANLDCSYNNLSVVDVTALYSLKYFDCSNNKLIRLNTLYNGNLRYIDCSNNLLTYLDLTTENLVNLNTLDCSNNKLDSLKIGQSILNGNIQKQKFGIINCQGNKLPFSSLNKIYKCLLLYQPRHSFFPQDTIFQSQTYYEDIFINYSREALINDTFTHFIFYKDDSLIEENDKGIFKTQGSGKYFCVMKNNMKIFKDSALITAPITIIPEILIIPDTLITISANDETTKSIYVMSNNSWKASCSETWIQLITSEGHINDTLKFKTISNKTSSSQKAVINIEGKNKFQNITVVQLADTVSSQIINCQYPSISIYPNPVSEKLWINNYTRSSLSIKILSMDGNIFYSIKTQEKTTEINIRNLPSGVYIVRIKTNNSLNISKIIKY